ncbi:MAG TPA: amino-acid N-acetyltransferase [Burkholderiales bacterium]|nr:amino-acid N-acetyltransferase [Burkholderiales bacterium]
MPHTTPTDAMAFVQWLRSVAPYIHAFRGHTFVIAFGGEVVSDGRFVALTHDFNLLHSLGVHLVLVHGARAQIEARLNALGQASRYVKGLRVTDNTALQCAKEAVGRIRADIETLLSTGLPGSPMAGAQIRVASGNFVIAKPMGVIEGVDLQHTGEVRKIDTAAIEKRLNDGEMVLLSPLGYSPTGEIFNLALEDVATSAAIALGADKLIFLMEEDGVTDASGKLLKELTVPEAEKLVSKQTRLSGDVRLYLPCALRACREGVTRAHLLSRHVEGAVLLELFTHEGIGSMVTQTGLEKLRQAHIEDVGGILALVEPLEREGVLVRRPRELLEMEISRFSVMEHDGAIIGCAALYPFPREDAGELACLVVQQNYRKQGCGDILLRCIEKQARDTGMRKLFVLTTRAAHWFIERGFKEGAVEQLPGQKQALYNFQRRSKVLVKRL